MPYLKCLRAPSLMIGGGAIALLLVAAAHGQADAAASPGAAPAESSLVGAFFVSRQTDPASGAQSVELLGSLIIWSLLALSVVSVGLIGHMAWANQRKSLLPPGVVDQVTRLIRGGKYREVLDLTRADHSFFSSVMHAGLKEAGHGYAAVIHSMERMADELTTDRLRCIEYLNVLGQVSPMVGLFGTVYGMILAFRAIVMTGGDADPVLLAGGISTALTTTFWGLVVAIPALAGYAIVRNRIDAFTAEATVAAEQLLSHFRPRNGKPAERKPAAES